MSLVSERLNHLVDQHQQKLNKIAKLMVKSGDDVVDSANRFKVDLFNGECESSARIGHKSHIVWRNPYDDETCNYYKNIQSEYGSYEGTWMEVNRMRFQGNDYITDENGDTLVVSINW